MSKGSYVQPVELLDHDSRADEILPILRYSVSIAEVFMFSAITWNRHRIHYDKQWAIEEGHKGVLVQRGLLGNVLCRYIDEVFVDPVIKKLHWKVLNSTLAGSTLTASGTITKSAKTVDGMKLYLALMLSNDIGVQVCQSFAEVDESLYRHIQQSHMLPYRN